MSRDEMTGIAQELKAQIIILGGLVALAWGIEVVDLALRGSLDVYGIVPRNVVGLRGILFAPFLHGNLPHLLANTVPFVTLGWFVMLRRTSDFFVVSAIAMLVGGLGTWLFGRSIAYFGAAQVPLHHIGASGVIFGYLGYLLARGYFERSFLAIALSVLVAVLYGGLLWGVLPGQVGISWEGHLFGFIGGVIAARLMVDRRNTNASGM